MTDLKSCLANVIEGKSLTQTEAQEIMTQIMSGQVTPAQLAALITGLKIKGETVDEITGFALAMREKATPVMTNQRFLVDTCGTGGDGSSTFNISTATALVVAGAGLTVAKHGNRSVSSKCGSADVLEELGVNLAIDASEVAKCIDEIGIGFLFAPLFHPAMKHAAAPRKELGFRSIFNLLGPLTNPLGAKYQVVGVYDANLTEVMAKVLHKLGIAKAFVVSGIDGLDEVSITGPTKITRLEQGQFSTFFFEPDLVNMKTCKIDAIKGDTPKENAKIILEILGGEKGPRRDIVLINSAFSLMSGGMATDIVEGIEIAAEAIDSGKAFKKLELLVKYSRKEVA
jgi:anthranilate phosphoribosyltransferase